MPGDEVKPMEVKSAGAGLGNFLASDDTSSSLSSVESVASPPPKQRRVRSASGPARSPERTLSSRAPADDIESIKAGIRALEAAASAVAYVSLSISILTRLDARACRSKVSYVVFPSYAHLELVKRNKDPLHRLPRKRRLLEMMTIAPPVCRADYSYVAILVPVRFISHASKRATPSTMSQTVHGSNKLPAIVGKNMFKPLMECMLRTNPRVFELPHWFLEDFPGLCPNPENGQFIDTNTVTVKPVTLPFRDRKPSTLAPFVAGTDPAVCFACGKSASRGPPLLNHLNSFMDLPPLHQTNKSPLIQCGYCDLYWHTDCLDPPLTGGLPPEIKEQVTLVDVCGAQALRDQSWGRNQVKLKPLLDSHDGFVSVQRKWMCPCHAEWAIQNRKHLPRGWRFVSREQERYFKTIKDAVDVSSAEPVPASSQLAEKIRLPEHGVILDFVSGVRGPAKPPITMAGAVEANVEEKRAAPGDCVRISPRRGRGSESSASPGGKRRKLDALGAEEKSRADPQSALVSTSHENGATAATLPMNHIDGARAALERRASSHLDPGLGVAFTSFLGELYKDDGITFTPTVGAGSRAQSSVRRKGLPGLRCTEKEADEWLESVALFQSDIAKRLEARKDTTTKKEI